MCGVAGAGKSTYARALESRGWLRISIDQEMWRRGICRLPWPAALAEQIRSVQRDEVADALKSGRDVVVDYSFWQRAQRDEYRSLGLACGAAVRIVYIPVPEHELRRRLATRRTRDADDLVVNDETLAGYLLGFEAPATDEDDVTVLDPAEERPAGC